MRIYLERSTYGREECTLNDFDNEDVLEDFEVEITDLDSDREKSRASDLWCYGQHVWSYARLWMTLLTVVGVTILVVTLLPPFLIQFSHGSAKAPGIAASHSSQQEFNCNQSSGSILIVPSTYNGVTYWNKARGLPDELQMVMASCTQSIDVQIVSGGTGNMFWYRKK